MISLHPASNLCLRMCLALTIFLATISAGFAQVVSGISVSPTATIGGISATGTVKLSSPAKAGGFTVPLFSSDVAAYTPVWVVFPEGVRVVTFTVGTRPVIADTVVTLSAIADGIIKTTTLTVLPTKVLKLTLDPTKVKAGANSTATVTLVAPAPKDGLKVALSSNSSAAIIASEITIPEGQISGDALVSTVGVPDNGVARITGSAGGASAFADLTISSAKIKELILSSPVVSGGSDLTAQVNLDGPAPLFGQKVTLTSDNGVATVPTSVTVASGQTSATFTIKTSVVMIDNEAIIAGTTFAVTKSAKLKIVPQFQSILFTPAIAIGGTSSTGTISLSRPAPKFGLTFTLVSDTSAISVPASVSIPEGGSTVTFTATTTTVGADVNGGVTASGAGTTRVGTLKVLSPKAVGFTLNPATLTGGAKSEAVITIDGPAPIGGLPIALTTNSGSVIPPSTVTVLEGKTSIKFDILTTAVTSDGSVDIKASVSGAYKIAKMRVLAPILAKLEFTPTFAIGGTVGTGVVTLTGPAAAGGYKVKLYSNKAQAAVAPEITLPEGITTMTFPITTVVVPVDVLASISAQGGTSKLGNFTVKTGPPIAVSPWAKFRGNSNNTGAGQGPGSNGNLAWSFNATESIYSSASIGQDGTIYVGADDANPGVEAFAANGTHKWSFATGGWVYSSPAVTASGRVYVGSVNKVFAINPNGTKLWDFTTGGFVLSSPAIGPDGTVYVGSYDKNLYALNPNGTLKWKFLTKDRIYSSPAVGADGTIYFGSLDGSVFALNPNGTQKWAFVTGGGVASSPAIGPDGVVYVGSNDGSLYAIKDDGKLKWSYSTGAAVSSSPAIGLDGTIYVASSKTLLAISSIGKKKWGFGTKNFIEGSPALATDGTVYIGSLDGNVYAVKSNGVIRWYYTTAGAVHASPTIGSDGRVYIGSLDAKFYVFK